MVRSLHHSKVPVSASEILAICIHVPLCALVEAPYSADSDVLNPALHPKYTDWVHTRGKARLLQKYHSLV